MFQECVNNCMKICTCGAAEETSPVVLLTKEGQVMEFPKKIRCSEVLATNPHYRICHASALLLRQKGQILAATSWLQPGEIYFLLPKPGAPMSAKSAKGPESSLQFKIPKEYLDRVLGSATKPAVRKRIKKPPPKVALKRVRSRPQMLTAVESSMHFVVPKDVLMKSGEEAAAAHAPPPVAHRPILRRCPSVGKARPQIRLRRNRPNMWQPPLDTIAEGSSRSSNGGTSSRSSRSAASRSFTDFRAEPLSESLDIVSEIGNVSSSSQDITPSIVPLERNAECGATEAAVHGTALI